MVSPKPIPAKEEPPSGTNLKRERKKKGYRGETVADRLLASAKQMEQLRLAESLKANNLQNNDKKEETNDAKDNRPVKLTKIEKLEKATHEIDDLSALEWETSSEQSGL